MEMLAAMVKRGFDQAATKEEITGLKREMALFRDQLERLGADVHDIKITLGLMTRAVASQEVEIKNLQHRMVRIEKKVGLAR